MIRWLTKKARREAAAVERLALCQELHDFAWWLDQPGCVLLQRLARELFQHGSIRNQHEHREAYQQTQQGLLQVKGPRGPFKPA